MARPQRFCLVGAGAHARTKLIPALEANGQEIVGVVSSQAKSALGGRTVYDSLETAMEKLADDTAFLVATPPAAHFAQVKAIVRAGRDVSVEKPAFVTGRDAREIERLCASVETVVAEGFMHRHTAAYERLAMFWASQRPRITRLEMGFLIPEAPVGTFRREREIASSSIFDIGCYPVSLLADLGLDLGPLRVADVAFPGIVDQECVRVAGVLDGVEVTAQIGVGPRYANFVSIDLRGGDGLRCEPFFYGRKGAKSITRLQEGAAAVETLNDHDGFEAMFAMTRETWLADQPRRLAQMIEVADKLETLGQQVSARRAAAQGSGGLGSDPRSH